MNTNFPPKDTWADGLQERMAAIEERMDTLAAREEMNEERIARLLCKPKPASAKEAGPSYTQIPCAVAGCGKGSYGWSETMHAHTCSEHLHSAPAKDERKPEEHTHGMAEPALRVWRLEMYDQQPRRILCAGSARLHLELGFEDNKQYAQSIVDMLNDWEQHKAKDERKPEHVCAGITSKEGALFKLVADMKMTVDALRGRVEYSEDIVTDWLQKILQEIRSKPDDGSHDEAAYNQMREQERHHLDDPQVKDWTIAHHTDEIHAMYQQMHKLNDRIAGLERKATISSQSRHNINKRIDFFSREVDMLKTDVKLIYERLIALESTNHCAFDNIKKIVCDELNARRLAEKKP